MWQAYVWSLQAGIEAAPTIFSCLQGSLFSRVQHVDNAHVGELRQHGLHLRQDIVGDEQPTALGMR